LPTSHPLAIAEALHGLGAVVVEAASADEAWERLTTGEAVDLIFTDPSDAWFDDVRAARCQTTISSPTRPRRLRCSIHLALRHAAPVRGKRSSEHMRPQTVAAGEVMITFPSRMIPSS
jgi:hypothetical protein